MIRDRFRAPTLEAAVAKLNTLVPVHASAADTAQYRRRYLDGCIISALSCGDIELAARMVEQSSQFVPDEPSTNAVSRNTVIFREAYNKYPPELRRRFDAVIAAHRNTFESAPIGDQNEALGPEAVRRHEQSSVETRNRALADRNVALVEQRESRLSSAAVETAIQDGLTNEDSRDALDNKLNQSVDAVVNGQVANGISAELARRLFPDINAGEIARNEQTRATGGDARRRYDIGLSRALRSRFIVRDRGTERELTAEERVAAVKNVFLDEAKLRDMLFNPTQLDEQALIVFLKNPQYVLSTMEAAIKSMEQTQGYGSADVSSTDLRQQTAREAIVRKLAPAVYFIMALRIPQSEPLRIDEVEIDEDGTKQTKHIDNPQYRQDAVDPDRYFERVLREEFGLTKEVQPDNLDACIRALCLFNAGIPVFSQPDEEDIERSIALIATHVSEDQYSRDAEVAVRIAETAQRERIQRLTEVEQQVDDKLALAEADWSNKLAAVETAVAEWNTARPGLEEERASAAADEENAQRLIEEIDVRQTKKPSMFILSGIIKVYTEDRKAADLAAAQTSLAAAQATLDNLKHKELLLQPTENVEDVQRKLAAVRKLQRVA